MKLQMFWRAFEHYFKRKEDKFQVKIWPKF